MSGKDRLDHCPGEDVRHLRPGWRTSSPDTEPIMTRCLFSETNSVRQAVKQYVRIALDVSFILMCRWVIVAAKSLSLH